MMLWLTLVVSGGLGFFCGYHATAYIHTGREKHLLYSLAALVMLQPLIWF